MNVMKSKESNETPRGNYVHYKQGTPHYKQQTHVAWNIVGLEAMTIFKFKAFTEIHSRGGKY